MEILLRTIGGIFLLLSVTTLFIGLSEEEKLRYLILALSFFILSGLMFTLG